MREFAGMLFKGFFTELSSLVRKTTEIITKTTVKTTFRFEKVSTSFPNIDVSSEM